MQTPSSVNSALSRLRHRIFPRSLVEGSRKSSLEEAAVVQPPSTNLLNIFGQLSDIPLLYTDKQKALKRITELCQQAVGSHACTLALVDLNKDLMTFGAATGPDKEFEDFMSKNSIKIGKPENGQAMDRELIAAGEVVERYRLPHNGQGIANATVAEKYNLQAGLCHPLKSEGQLLGYLNHFSSKLDRFTADEKNLLGIFAAQAVNVIERFDQYQSRDLLSQILNDLSASLLSLPPEKFFNRIAEAASQLLDVPVCIVWTLDVRTDTLRVAAATTNVNEEYRNLKLTREQFSQWEHLFQRKVSYLSDVRNPHHLYFHREAAQERK
jgi:hypothetical protein